MGKGYSRQGTCQNRGVVEHAKGIDAHSIRRERALQSLPDVFCKTRTNLQHFT